MPSRASEGCVIDDRQENTQSEARDDPFEIEGPTEYHVHDNADAYPYRAFEEKSLPKG